MQTEGVRRESFIQHTRGVAVTVNEFHHHGARLPIGTGVVKHPWPPAVNAGGQRNVLHEEKRPPTETPGKIDGGLFRIRDVVSHLHWRA
jgi:hypothetical protein